MATPWVSLLNLIRNGESVSADVTNRPIIELSQRTEYLKTIIDTLSLGRAIFDTDVPMNPSVFDGCAVYWDSTNKEYAPALAQLSYNADGIYGGNADSAYVVGVCAGKSTQTRGIVLFSGSASGVDFSNAIEGGGSLSTGPYFLSATEPGKMTRSRPSVGIYVMFGQESEGAIVAPSPREVLEDHIHYRLPLAYGDIVDGSGGVGWTDVFNVSLAPLGARFRYVVEEDAPVYALFPFMPSSSVYFEIDGIGSNSKVIIDLNGIWWIDDNYDPDDYQSMTVYYAKSALSTSNQLVRTLQAWTTESPLKVVNCRGESATAGDLYLQLSLQFEQQDDSTPGWLVFKELTDSQQFLRGPVVQRIKSASQEISITINGENGYTWGDGYQSGDLIITYNSPTGVARSLEPTLTELNGALQEDYNGIPYIALPGNNFESGVSFRFDVPVLGLAGEFNLAFNAWVYTSVSGTLPSEKLGVSFKILRTVTEATPTKLLSSVITVANKYLETPLTVSAAGYCRAVCSDLDGNTLEPGDQVHVTVSRKDNEYAGTLGIMKAWCEITQA